MNIRIFLQRPEYNFERDEYFKNKNKIALPAQYSMSFLDKHAEVVYILVFIKPDIGNYMDIGRYVCGVLDYNIGTWWNCDDDTITNHSSYP